MSRFQRPSAANWPEAFENMRADYNAARENRYRRQRRGYLITGSNADFHYRLQTDFLRMIEYARCMDRDDALFGTLVDRSSHNVIHNGFRLDPKTGDRVVDRDLKGRWNGWASDADECDLAGEHAFPAMEHFVYRSAQVDGDHIVLPTNQGKLQLTEAHLCRTPQYTRRNVIQGVFLDDFRKRVEYWISKQDVDPWIVIYKVSDMVQIPTRDAQGNRQVFHVYNPKRTSQTRSISVMAPMIDLLSMAEDIFFATLVKQQAASCFVTFRERDASFDGPEDPGQAGERHTHIRRDGSVDTVENIQPGMQIVGWKGEKLTGFAPNIPAPGFFEHYKLVVSLIGVNLGLPWCVGMMDAEATNYSGFRGSLEQAKIGFRHNQNWLIRRFHRPVYRWKVRQWLAEDPALRHAAKRSGIDIFGHEWGPPGWPYVDPQKERASDLMAVRNGLSSHRRIQKSHGEDWETVSTEIVEDNGAIIAKAKTEARKLNEDVEHDSERVTWKDCISLPTPDGVTMTIAADDKAEADDAAQTKKAQNGSGNANGKGGQNGRFAAVP